MSQQELNELKADLAAASKETAERKARRAAAATTWPTLSRGGFTYRKSTIIKPSNLSLC